MLFFIIIAPSSFPPQPQANTFPREKKTTRTKKRSPQQFVSPPPQDCTQSGGVSSSPLTLPSSFTACFCFGAACAAPCSRVALVKPRSALSCATAPTTPAEENAWDVVETPFSSGPPPPSPPSRREDLFLSFTSLGWDFDDEEVEEEVVVLDARFSFCIEASVEGVAVAVVAFARPVDSFFS